MKVGSSISLFKLRVSATMMFWSLFIVFATGVDSWRLLFLRVAGLGMFLDSLFVYTPIPSIFTGVRRLHFVEFWRTHFHYTISIVLFCSIWPNISACCFNFDLET